MYILFLLGYALYLHLFTNELKLPKRYILRNDVPITAITYQNVNNIIT